MVVISAALYLTLLVLIGGYAVWCSSYWRRHGVRGPSGFPLCGNMLQFLLGRKNFGDIYEQIYKEHPHLPYVGIYRVFNEPAILLRSQDMVKEVMVRSFQHFQDNVLWIDPQRDPIAVGNPFLAKGDKWKETRAELLPVFTPNRVKSSFPHIKNICDKLKTYVAEHMDTNCFEAKDLFSKFTLDVVASAAYGLDGQSFVNHNSDFTQLVEDLFLPNPWSLRDTLALLFSPTLGKLINYRYVPSPVHTWLSSIISSVLAMRLRAGNTNELDPKSGVHNDFVQWLLEARIKQNLPIDRSSILGHCGTFLLEGFETSSSLMAFALFEYATNPVEQQRVLDEIDEVLARYGGELSYEALQEMNYFEASLLETLRLHPPMLALLKHCTKPFELPPQDKHSKPFKVPVGMVFVVPVNAVHSDPDLYEEPAKFQPQRFLTQSDRQRLGCKYLAFGEGPRMCPGMRFGLAQSKAGLAMLLSKYTVHLLDSKTHLPLKIAPTTFLTVAVEGIWVRFEPRRQEN